MLKTYSGEKVVSLGAIDVNVDYEGKKNKTMLKSYVVEKGGPDLFVQEQLNWKGIKGLLQCSSNIQNGENLDNILKHYSSFFSG